MSLAPGRHGPELDPSEHDERPTNDPRCTTNDPRSDDLSRAAAGLDAVRDELAHLVALDALCGLLPRGGWRNHGGGPQKRCARCFRRHAQGARA